jgi:hypothetical protein
MKKSVIILGLFFSTTLIAMDSIYDGTGSLINANQPCWGCDRDEAIMHPHKNKNSTVTFQVLRDELKCTHINIHSNIDLGQDVKINLKGWSDTSVKKSYKARLPKKSFGSKDGVSLEMENLWTTLAISTTKPINQKAEIYAYCRNSTDSLNESGLELMSPEMTQLDNGHSHLGNGSLITISEDNGQGGYGLKKDMAVASKTYDAETSFQILTNKDTCSEVTINGTSPKIEEILIKGWSENKWRPTSCDKLPCTIALNDDIGKYIVTNIKTKANSSNKYLYANCGKNNIKFDLKEKVSRPKHPNDCKFNDVIKSDYNEYQYVTALCSAGIVEGYGHTNYTEFGPDNPTLWSELTKVVNLAANFYKTKKIRDSYSSGNWYDAYVKIAKDQGFDYTNNPQFEVKRGLAYKYIVKVFWNKDMTEEESSTFLRDKGITYRSNITPTIKRGYMAEVVLKSAKMSADESGIERKIPYTNHDKSDLNIKEKQELPEPTFETPKSTDSDTERKEIVRKNIEKATKEDNVVSEKNYTDNTGLTVNVLGGKTNLKESFQEKATAEEIIDEVKSQGVDTSVSSYSKIKKDSIVEIMNTNTGETIIAPTKEETDTEGNAKISMEVSPGKVEAVDKKTLEENGLKVASQVEIQNVMKKKGE